MSHRVVVTGMGAVSPIGLDVPHNWQSVVNGVSGVAPITLFDASDLEVQIACEVKGFEPELHLARKDARRRDRFEQFAAAAASEAAQQANLVIHESQAGRVAVIISSSVGGLSSLLEALLTIEHRGARRVGPFAIPMYMPNGASGMVGIDIGAKGPCYSVGSACASGADGIGHAWMLIRSGLVDVAIAGGTEATVVKLAIAAFDRLGALSHRNEDYTSTPAPFDRHRDGLVIGEGAGVMVLESLEHAEARGCEILAEVVGYGSTADAFHITAPGPLLKRWPRPESDRIR